MPQSQPFKKELKPVDISVVIPAHNSELVLARCLESLQKSIGCSFEIIVVDDASTDRTKRIASELGAHVVTLLNQRGPAAARNRGVCDCRGEIIAFVDSDVLVSKNVLQQFCAQLRDESISAVFGSYDQQPTERGYISTYKNLMHHHFHQRSLADVGTFWTGCGAIRRTVFEQLGGFNENFAQPCIEDIELGMRLKKLGHMIRLSPQIQAKHTKRWTFCSLVYTDVFRRGIPWTRLMLRGGGIKNDLNTSWEQKVCVGTVGIISLCFLAFSLGNPLLLFLPFLIVFLILLTDRISQDANRRDVATTVSSFVLVSTCFSFLIWEPFLISVVIGAAIIWALNASSIVFLCRVEGFCFALMSLPLHLIYYLYCGFSFSAGVFLHVVGLPLFPETTVKEPA